MFSAKGKTAGSVWELLDKLPISYSGPIEFYGVKLTTPIETLRVRAMTERSKLETEKVTELWTARIDITPRPALKTTHKARFSEESKGYLRYQAEIATKAKEWGFDPKWTVSDLELVFLMPLPASYWNAMGITPAGFLLIGQRHEQMPDTENMIKPVQDALQKKDQAVSDVRGRKFWSPIKTGAIIIKLRYY